MPEFRNKYPYENIIGLPHYVSERHRRMSAIDRAAQFSPFAALAGFEAALNETARLTTKKIELSEEQKALLDERLHLLLSMLPQRPETTFVYFIPDSRKEGGAYVAARGQIKRIDDIKRLILLTNGSKIPVDDVVDIQCGTVNFDSPAPRQPAHIQATL